MCHECERERYRRALEAIRDHPGGRGVTKTIRSMIQIATEALKR